MKVKKAEAMVTPKKIRKMYREAVKESLDKGVTKESRRMLFIRHIIIAILAVYGLAVSIGAIIGLAMLAKQCGL